METFSALPAHCAGNSPVTGEFPHKSQWRGALVFSLTCAWTNGWVNNRYAGGLGRHRTHYDVTVMMLQCPIFKVKAILYKITTHLNVIQSTLNQVIFIENLMWAHYDDVIIGAIASQITSLTIVYSTVYSNADQRKHQSSASVAFVRGIHRSPVNSPHKWASECCIFLRSILQRVIFITKLHLYVTL